MARKRGRNETPEERADRNLSELLQELRVALPGIQVLFAFLLTVPFTQRFTSLSDRQEALYFLVLLLTALTTVLLMAPTTMHRLLFRKRDKEHLVVVSNRFAIAGLAVLALAMTGVVLLISDVIFTPPEPLLATLGTGLVFGTVWFVYPLLRRWRMREEPED